MSTTEQSWTWLDLGVLTRLVIGWGNLCIMGRTQEYDFSWNIHHLDLPCPHKSAPGPFPSNLDLTRTHWSQTCSLNVPADVQTEVGPWTMVQKKTLPVVNIPKKQGNCGRGFSNLVWDTFPDIRHLNLTCGICQTECQIECQNIYIYNYIYIYVYRIYTSRWYVKIMCQGGNHSKKVMKFLASLPEGRVDSFCAENSMKVAFKHCGNCSPQTNLAYCWSGSCSGGISLTLK